MKLFVRITAMLAMALLVACSDSKSNDADQELLSHLYRSQYLSLKIDSEGYEVVFTDGSTMSSPYSSSTLISVSPNGYWQVNGAATGIKAQRNSKNEIDQPEVKVGADGKWTIDGVSTGVGIPGTDAEASSLICTIATPDAITFRLSSGATYTSKRYISEGERYILQARRMQRPIKILMCGNSWSLNAAEYLNKVLYSMGIESKIVVAYVGGGSIEDVWKSAQLGLKSFLYNEKTSHSENWTVGGSKMSVEQMLTSDDFDIVTFQQVSTQAGAYSSVSPYLQNLIDWATWLQQANEKPVPDYYLHVTWAYPEGSKRMNDSSYDGEQAMYEAIMSAWSQLYSEVRPQGVINSATIMRQARLIDGITRVDTEDGGHADEVGKVALAYGFAETLLRTFFEPYLVDGNYVTGNSVWRGNLNLHTEAQSDIMKANAVEIVADQDKYFK